MKKHIGVSHEDERRSLISIINGDFDAKQIKILKIKKDSIMGNHYHDYKEMFYILRGRAKYTLENIDTKERSDFILNEGDRLIIPPITAHKAMISNGTITIEATERPYISPEINDMRYEFD